MTRKIGLISVYKTNYELIVNKKMRFNCDRKKSQLCLIVTEFKNN